MSIGNYFRPVNTNTLSQSQWEARNPERSITLTASPDKVIDSAENEKRVGYIESLK